MTTQDLIREIQSKNPQISREQILERLKTERAKTGGLLEDETLLRLIAAKFGVIVQHEFFHNSGVLSTSRLFAGLNDVTVAGRLIAVFPPKTFEGPEKSGKLAVLMIADKEGILRVVLWNEKADLVDNAVLKAGQAVRLLHGYTRDDRYGKTELHIGSKGQIELEPEDTTAEYPSIDKFNVKINTLTAMSGNIHLTGTVKAVLSKTNFARSNQTEGVVMRLTIADESGQVTMVVWNEKTAEIENLALNSHLQLVNAKVKETANGDLEVHVDSGTFVSIL
jgi:replication factor A1